VCVCKNVVNFAETQFVSFVLTLECAVPLMCSVSSYFT